MTDKKEYERRLNRLKAFEKQIVEKSSDDLDVGNGALLLGLDWAIRIMEGKKKINKDGKPDLRQFRKYFNYNKKIKEKNG